MADNASRAQPGSAFATNLSYHLSILSFLLGKATAEIYHAEDLTTHQWKVLSVICHYGPIPAAEITKWVTLDKSAISRAVARLRELGFIDRRLSNSDARVSEIMSTKLGMDSYRRMSDQVARLQTTLLDGLPEDKVQVLFENFAHLEGKLRERFGVVPDDLL
jgi:DNA-binding MarR family transcriptional regulator